MTKLSLRVSALVEQLRESLWFIPGGMVAAAVVLASFLALRTSPAPAIPLRSLLLPSSADAAATVLQVLASSVITVTSVVFSLTVVALQITAGNYSPRVLRTFLRDVGTQIVLGTFLATFAYSYLVLQNVRPIEGEGGARWAPELAFMVIPLFVLASLVALVFFIHHVTQAIRVDLILQEVREDTLRTIDKAHPREEGRRTIDEAPRDLVPDDALEVKATSSGFIQRFNFEDLIDTLNERDLVVGLRPAVGDHVLKGATIAWIWRRAGGGSDIDDGCVAALYEAVQIGRERSITQDVAYGLRQIVDIAVRALSPGVNDPHTAIAAILQLAVTYRTLLERPLGTVWIADGESTERIVVPYPSLEEYLHIMCQQVGHYGRHDVMVVLRLLRELKELKMLAPARHHDAIDVGIQEVMREAGKGLDVEENLELARAAADDARLGSFRLKHYTVAG